MTHPNDKPVMFQSVAWLAFYVILGWAMIGMVVRWLL
jgi:hypothetical protein